MNRSKIEWTDHTWNPITGCLYNCPYCYARHMTQRFSGNIRLNKMATQNYKVVRGAVPLYELDAPMLNETGSPLVYPFGFEPTFHRYRLKLLDKLKMGTNIFVGAMADVFGEWVPREWIEKVINECIKHPQHNYLFLTKNPDGYCNYGVPTGFDNIFYGVSITREREMQYFNLLPAFCNTYVSLEPILEDLNSKQYNVLFKQVKWIIVGAETGNNCEKVIPKWEWIKSIVELADSNGVPVFMKDSLINIVGEENMRREFPQQLNRKVRSEGVKRKMEGSCTECGIEMDKNKMLALSVRSKRGEMPKQLCHICKNCFVKLCDQWGVDIPALENLAIAEEK